ncbi:MAG: hypothetical protein JWQ81_734 [Amycolatopsis sp.]|jgi:hypothetical protein|uniref:hypothetical protein n=1 Tax=Amycolatopsis sp. TaxID=37632 RepID=UPI0026064A3F|nr:hypothetical protein [Amycolatopsis sp.]MCU1679995.1 hypothetical protein [Amycolatopsis sp.]
MSVAVVVTADLIDGYQTVAAEYGYRATYFIQMVGELGGAETVMKLVAEDLRGMRDSRIEAAARPQY